MRQVRRLMCATAPPAHKGCRAPAFLVCCYCTVAVTATVALYVLLPALLYLLLQLLDASLRLVAAVHIIALFLLLPVLLQLRKSTSLFWHHLWGTRHHAGPHNFEQGSCWVETTRALFPKSCPGPTAVCGGTTAQQKWQLRL